MTILVTGARGNIGSRVVEKLAGHRVRATTRAELDIAHPNPAALRDVETVFLYPIREAADEFLAAATEAGVRHVVLLSSPAAYEPGEHDRPIGLLHRAMERSLARSGLNHTVLYPSWLATNARRDWSEQIRSSAQVSMAYPDAQVAPIHIDDVAEVAAELLIGARHRGRMQVLTGPESLRLREVVGILGEALGTPVPVEELTRDEALARRAPWMPEPILEVLLDIAAASVGVPALVNNNVERITGHPARPFHEWAQTHRTDFGTTTN